MALNSSAEGSVTIDTEIDTDGLKKAIDQMNKVMDGFVKKVSGGLTSIDKGVDKTAQKAKKLKIEPTTEGIDEATRNLKNFQLQIEIQKREIDDYRKEHEKLSEEFGDTSTQALKMERQILVAEDALEKLKNTSKELAEDIDNAQYAMSKGAKSAESWNKKLEESEGASKKAKEGMTAFGHAISHFAIDIVEKATSKLVSLIKETKEFRDDMSKLEQNARDTGTSMQTVDDAMRSLNAITGETDSNIEAVSNLLAAGFTDNNLQEAVDTLAGAVIKFPDTIKIESLSDSLQETIATKEATGQFAEVLGRVGVNVEDYNKRIAKMSEAQARNFTISLLQKKGLEDVTKDWRENNREMVEAADAAYELQKTQAELAAVMDPIRTKILTAINKLLSENKDTIQNLIQVVGNVIQFIIRAVDAISKIPSPVLLLAAAILVVVAAVGKFSVGAVIAANAIAAGTKALAKASPAAASAGASFALLALEITAVATAIAIVIAAIAKLVSAIRGVPAIGIDSNLTKAPSIGGYATGTASARRGLALVGERGPELVNFGGGERVYNATQTAAMRSLARSGGGTYQDNRQYIFKVDDIATYVAIEKRMQGESQSRRMGYVGAY